MTKTPHASILFINQLRRRSQIVTAVRATIVRNASHLPTIKTTPSVILRDEKVVLLPIDIVSSRKSGWELLDASSNAWISKDDEEDKEEMVIIDKKTRVLNIAISGKLAIMTNFVTKIIPTISWQ